MGGAVDYFSNHRLKLRFPWRFAHRPRLAVGDLVFSLGVLAGAGEWALFEAMHRLSRGRPTGSQAGPACGPPLA